MFLLHAKARLLHWTYCTKNMEVSVKKLSDPLDFHDASVLQSLVSSWTHRGRTRCIPNHRKKSLMCEQGELSRSTNCAINCKILWAKCKQSHAIANLCQLKLYLFINFTMKSYTL